MTQRLLAPRTWPSWLLLGTLRLLAALPWALQRRLGASLGHLVFLFPSRFKQVVLTNLALCLPNYTERARYDVALQHFKDLGISLFESALTWWGNDMVIERLSDVEGIDYLERSQASGRGVILTSYHSTTLSIGARIINHHIKICPLYRPTKNPVIAYVSGSSFQKRSQQAILHTDIRQMVQRLKDGQIVWYIADQNFRRKGAVKIPFFNIPAATNAFAPRLAQMTNSDVYFYTCIRQTNDRYKVIIHPRLHWEGLDDFTAMCQYHQLIENAVTNAPSQYWWIHKRFKPLVDTDIDYYNNAKRP